MYKCAELDVSGKAVYAFLRTVSGCGRLCQREEAHRDTVLTDGQIERENKGDMVSYDQAKSR